MKNIFTFMVVFLFSWSLVGCSCHRYQAYPRSNFTEECWQAQVGSNPNAWSKHADRWFTTGKLSCVEVANRHAPNEATISTTMVRVPDFTKIRANGNFHLQIIGTTDHNKVFMIGPTAGTSAVAVSYHGGGLWINQTHPSPCMKRVIIRVSVNNLNSLLQMGSGPIEAVQIRSNGLRVKSIGSGNIYLGGSCLALQKVELGGRGCINVFGVETPRLIIRSMGWGRINIAGKVGIRSIVHGGFGDINIIGASSCGLCINAAGCGKISIVGLVNTQRILARDNVKVYIMQNYGNFLCADIANCARVGVNGRVRELKLRTTGASRFWGKGLCTIDAYVKTYDESHVNVTTRNRIFASARDYSSIYFYGSPKSLSQFATGSANIVPIALEEPSCCTPACVADKF